MESEIIHPVTGRPCKKPSKGWRFQEEQIRQMLADGLFYFGENENTIPQPKKYLINFQTQIPKSTVFFDSQSSTKLLGSWGLDFDFPKPVALIKHILSIFPDNIKILDFFAGSGTTLQAALELNTKDGGKRQCILCTNNELGENAKKKAGNATSEEREQYGVCHAVTWPRLKIAITGMNIKGDKISEGFPGNNLHYYKISDDLDISESACEAYDFLRIKGIPYVELKENAFRCEDHGDWQLLYNDDAEIVVTLDYRIGRVKARERFLNILTKPVRKIYYACLSPNGASAGYIKETAKDGGEVLFVPYPKEIMDKLINAGQRIGRN